MHTPVESKAYTAAKQNSMQSALEDSERSEEALKAADFDIYRLVTIMNVMLGREGSKFRISSHDWPKAFEAISRHLQRQNGTYEGAT